MNATTPPLVYTLIVNWNGKEDTLACLESLQKISYKNYKITVIDNASTDGSVQAIAAKYPTVEIIRNQKNERFARANNQGIDLALENGASYILLLNNDTVVDPAFLDFMVARAQKDPCTGMVGPKIYYADQPNVLWYAGGEILLPKGRIAHTGIRELDAGQFDRAGETGYATGCCILANRECIEKIGFLDESYFIYTEDADWCWRARINGFKIRFEPRAKIWHKISSSSGGPSIAGGQTAFKTYYKIRGMMKFFGRYAKWYHWFTIMFFWKWQFLKALYIMIVAKNWAGIRAMFRAGTGRSAEKESE
ncbi:MAG: glycosyltransferase family 2 protein [bacterium]